MAHFAELDENGCVVNVVVLSDSVLAANGDESESHGIDFLESLFGHRRWKQTSYTGATRGRYAAVGMRYDAVKDEFLSRPDGGFSPTASPSTDSVLSSTTQKMANAGMSETTSARRPKTGCW